MQGADQGYSSKKGGKEFQRVHLIGVRLGVTQSHALASNNSTIPRKYQIPGTYTWQKHEPTPQRKEEWKHKRVLQHPLKLSTETPNRMVGVCLLNTRDAKPLCTAPRMTNLLIYDRIF